MAHDDPRYAAVNESREYPPLSRARAHECATALLRVFGDPAEAAMRGTQEEPRPARRSDLARIYQKWTRGNDGRRCWSSMTASSGVYYGWGRLIHDVSHMIHKYRHPTHRPHEHGHAQIEAEVLAYVERVGWLTPVIAATFSQSVNDPIKPVVVADPTDPAPEDEAQDKRGAKLDALLARMERWERKERRAANALRKLRAEVRRAIRELPREV